MKPLIKGRIYKSLNGAVWECIADYPGNLVNVRLIKVADILSDVAMLRTVGHNGSIPHMMEPGDDQSAMNGYQLIKEIEP